MAMFAKSSRRSNLIIAPNGDKDDARDLAAAHAKASTWLGDFDGFKEESNERGTPQEGACYWLPHDQMERARLDFQHSIFKSILDDKMHLAPISSPRRCLDFATGTGRWAIDFAKEYPDCDVLGTDISANMQPTSTPENYSFIVQDAEQTWQLGNQFDLIHGRALAACFGNNRAVVQHAFAQLNQGGYLEILDGIMPFRADDSSLQSSSLDEWQTAIFQEGMARLGRTPSDSQNWGKYLREEGFVDVVEKYYYVPIGPWCRGLEDKTRGIAMQQDLLMGLDAIGLPIFTNVLGWTKEEHDTLMEKAKVDLRSPDIHSYVEFYVVYGRKP